MHMQVGSLFTGEQESGRSSTMLRQTTLFGKAASKKLFFFGLQAASERSICSSWVCTLVKISNKYPKLGGSEKKNHQWHWRMISLLWPDWEWHLFFSRSAASTFVLLPTHLQNPAPHCQVRLWVVKSNRHIWWCSQNYDSGQRTALQGVQHNPWFHCAKRSLSKKKQLSKYRIFCYAVVSKLPLNGTGKNLRVSHTNIRGPYFFSPKIQILKMQYVKNHKNHFIFM